MAKKVIRKVEAKRVVDNVCCFECYFDSSKTDRFGETKVVIVASAAQLAEVNKLAMIKNQADTTLYAAFQVAHNAN
jgi:hypothetical protein